MIKKGLDSETRVPNGRGAVRVKLNPSSAAWWGRCLGGSHITAQSRVRRGPDAGLLSHSCRNKADLRNGAARACYIGMNFATGINILVKAREIYHILLLLLQTSSQLFQPPSYLSTSPNTKSMVPMMATASANR